MENRNLSQESLPSSVTKMGELKITGNITPEIWFRTIVLETGKPDLQSILILSDVSYWFRPTELRDEKSGKVIGFKKKFAEDLLRRSYADLENQFSFSSKQCQRSLQRLEDMGVIKRVFRSLKTQMGIIRNVMYLDLDVDVLRTLTFPEHYSNSPAEGLVHTSGQICPASFDVDSAINEPDSFASEEDCKGDLPSSSPTVDSDVHTYGQICPASRTNLSRSYKEANTLANNSSLSSALISENPSSSSAVVEREKLSISKKMLSTWNDLVPEKAQAIISKPLQKNLERTLKEQLGGNLENWKVVCENFRTSKFLMGEAAGISFTPSLSWLVDPNKSLVARVFAREHYTFGDRALAAKPMQDFAETEKEIEGSGEMKIVKEIRLFVLKSNPGFYNSYLKQATLNVNGDEVQLRSGSSFAKEKILEAFFEKINTFLKEKYQMNLEFK